MKLHRYVTSFILFLLFSAEKCLSNPIVKLDKSTIAEVNDYLMNSVTNGFSGSVLLSEGGNKLLDKGYGLANKEKNTVNGSKTIFDLGSNTKQFTATAILLLVQQGQLKTTAPISDFFKNLPDDKKAITIHQLLTHTSGLIESIGRDFSKISEEDFFRQTFDSELLFPIGTKHSYSNIGYSVLAKIIEIQSKSSYEDFLRKHIFLPTKMHNTGYLSPKWQKNHLANGYAMGIANQGSMVERYRENKTVYWHLIGNGGINSTQEDMFRWYQALKKNTVLNTEAFELLTTSHSTIFENYFYGYGWGINQSIDHTKRISHNGSNGSFAHNITWFPEEDILLLFSTNAASPITERMAKTIEKIIYQPDFLAEPIEKNPYLLVSDFIEYNDHLESENLMTLIKGQHQDKFTAPHILNRIGYNLLKDNKHSWAIEIFKINTEIFANDSNAWDSLGDAYLADNQRKKAKNSFEKAVSLGSQESKNKIGKLRP